MLRTPPASFVPYGSGSGAAAAAPGRHMAAAAAVISTSLLIAGAQVTAYGPPAA